MTVANNTLKAGEIAIGTTKKVMGLAVTIRGTMLMKMLIEVSTMGRKHISP